MSNQAVNFSDIFKSSFVDKMTSISFLDMFIAMILSFAVGLFIMQVYKKHLRELCIHQLLQCLYWHLL